jgi:hypothetical protein
MSKHPEFVQLDLENSDHDSYLCTQVRLIATLLEGRKLGTDEARFFREYGEHRFRQGASLSLVMEEARASRQAVLAVIQENLLALHVSHLIHDIIDICEWTDRMEVQAIDSYTRCWKALQAS